MSSVDVLQAAGEGDVAWLTRLLDAGCDANTVHPITGASALYNACFGSAIDVVRLLLSRGADPNKRLIYRSPVDGRVETDLVVLMVASSVQVIELLLEAGADPKAQCDDGRTVLMRLVGTAPSDAFRLLIAAGADTTIRARDGRSAADVAKQKLDWWRRFVPTKYPEHQADLRAILALLEPSESGGAA